MMGLCFGSIKFILFLVSWTLSIVSWALNLKQPIQHLRYDSSAEYEDDFREEIQRKNIQISSLEDEIDRLHRTLTRRARRFQPNESSSYGRYSKTPRRKMYCDHNDARTPAKNQYVEASPGSRMLSDYEEESSFEDNTYPPNPAHLFTDELTEQSTHGTTKTPREASMEDEMSHPKVAKLFVQQNGEMRGDDRVWKSVRKSSDFDSSAIVGERLSDFEESSNPVKEEEEEEESEEDSSYSDMDEESVRKWHDLILARLGIAQSIIFSEMEPEALKSDLLLEEPGTLNSVTRSPTYVYIADKSERSGRIVARVGGMVFPFEGDDVEDTTEKTYLSEDEEEDSFSEIEEESARKYSKSVLWAKERATQPPGEDEAKYAPPLETPKSIHELHVGLEKTQAFFFKRRK